MESYILKMGGRESGSILQNKTFVPLNGPILSISNSSPYKPISLVRAAWDKQGSRFVACDCQGNVFMFCIQKNRFFLVQRLTICSSFIIFTSDRSQDILVALTDCTIVSLSSESKSIKNKFYHHTASITNISFDKTGRIVLSCSKDQAILWDLSTFNTIRGLSLTKNVDIVKVFFVPDKDTVVSAFQDSSVFFWGYTDFKCVHQFVCDFEDSLLNIRSLDASSDGRLLACAGKSNWFLVWNIVEMKRLCSVLLPQHMLVKQIGFLASLPDSKDHYTLCLLNSEGDIHIYSLKEMEHVHKQSSNSGKFIFYASCAKHFQLLTISLQGMLELYDLADLFKDSKKEAEPKPAKVCNVRVKKKTKKSKKEDTSGIEKAKLKTMLKQFNEYPEKHRFFIWSQLLELPHNEDAFNVIHQESFQITFSKDYSFMNPGVRKTFLRIMSMLSCWHPVIQELEYYQCMVFPFAKVLHKQTIVCFELLITLISNWCQNWFLFCPFPPYNILCVVENMLAFHDKELMVHFAQNNISAEIFAWSLLKTSFSEVFNKKQWLIFWDHVFSNSLSFLLYAVVAFNIALKDVFLQCKSLDQFKLCYCRHSVSALVVVKKAHCLEETSPEQIRPDKLIGSFVPIPKGAYPSFIQMSQMNIDLQTHTRKSIIDQEIEYLKQREDSLEIRSNYLKELQMLQILRRKMFLESIDLKDEESIDNLQSKLKKVQNIIQENLTDQVAMLKGCIGEDIYLGITGDSRSNYFQFKDYMKKMMNSNYNDDQS